MYLMNMEMAPSYKVSLVFSFVFFVCAKNYK